MEGRRYRRVKYPQPTPLLDGVDNAPEPGWEGPDKLDNDELRGIDETWQCGYSQWPFGSLDDDVERWFGFTHTNDSVCAQLKTGELVKIVAEMPYMGG